MSTSLAISPKQSPSNDSHIREAAGPVPAPRVSRLRTLPRSCSSLRSLRAGSWEPALAKDPLRRATRGRSYAGSPLLVSSEVGIDIIETTRIRNVLEKHPRRFLDRVYTQWEQMYCRDNILHLSGRWAAKEAVSKVLGLGVRGVGWREIEIRRTRAGQPTVTLHGRAEERRQAIGLKSPLSVSISHIRDLAVAVAVGLS
jgi:holo-[acyl-carrier protein] synthase